MSLYRYNVLTQVFGKITGPGVESSLTQDQELAFRLTNIVAILGLFSILVASATVLYIGLPGLIFFDLLNLAALVLVIFLNHQGKHDRAKIFLILTLNVFVTGATLALPRETGMPWAFLPLLVVPELIFVNEKDFLYRRKWYGPGLPALLLVFCWFSPHSYYQISGKDAAFFYLCAYFVLVPVTVVLFHFWTNLLKEAREEALSSEAFLQVVLREMPLPLYCKDAQNEFRFSLWNSAAEKLWQIPAHRLLGKNDFDFLPHAEAQDIRQTDELVMRGQKMLLVEDENITLPEQGPRSLRTRKVPLGDRYLLVISEDITDQKRQQQSLIQSSKMASLGEMAAGLAHEINNPLAIIKGKSQFIRSRSKTQPLSPEDLQGHMQVIDQTVDRIARIIRGLKKFSRDASQDPFQEIDLRQIVDETVAFCSERFRNHSVDFRMLIEGTRFEVECLPTQISQVILNLLNNAFDVLVDQEEKWIELKIRDLDDAVELSVTDSGPGIPAELRSKIMQPFFTTKEVGKGTGLGLSISVGLIESHQGTLQLDPQSPRTRFVIRMPKTQTKRSKSA